MISDCIGAAPMEKYSFNGKDVYVSRHDLAYKAPLPPNAKMSALYEIVKRKSALGFTKMVLFAKKQKGIPYAKGFPYICKEFGVYPIITMPLTEQTDFPQWVYDIVNSPDCPPTTCQKLHPNMVSINVNQSKKIAEEQGAYFIPFGFDDRISVETHARHFNITQSHGTIVMATMTGMTLAGAILSSQRYQNTLTPLIGDQSPKFVGVSCGRAPQNVIKSMSKYITLPPDNKLEVVNPFERNVVFDTMGPFPLHVDYELKAWMWMMAHLQELEEPITFMNIGA